MKEKDYEFKTSEELIEKLLTLPEGTSIDFTFDTPEEAEWDGFEPSDWRGAKIVTIDGFGGGRHGVKERCLICGMWGVGILYCSPDIECYSDFIDGFTQFCKDEGMYGEYLCVSKKYNGE